ncbi:MAG: hypothetical protein ACRD4B_08670, partial [Acidobacteriota bacterium]
DIPEGFSEVGAISSELRHNPDKDIEDVISDRYADDFSRAGKLLVAKTMGFLVVTSGVTFAAANEGLKRRGGQRSWSFARSALAGGAGASALFAASICVTAVTFDQKDAGRDMDQAVTPFLQDYFTDRTTQNVAGIDAVSNEVSANLVRLDRYGAELSLSESLRDDLVYVTISSDWHDRTPVQEIEAINRVTGSVANSVLGDFINSGSGYEDELLAGPEIFETDFEGVQDIRTCELWNPEDPTTCDTEGERIPLFYVLGNHDEYSTAVTLNRLGAEHVDREIFRVPGIDADFAGADDGCFLPDADCHSDEGDNEANRRAGELLREELETEGVRPPV